MGTRNPTNASKPAQTQATGVDPALKGENWGKRQGAQFEARVLDSPGLLQFAAPGPAQL